MKDWMKRRRAAFSLAVLAALLALVWLPAQARGEEDCGGPSETFAGGNGTAECPYLIATADQLNNVRNDLGAHYKLIADIDLGVAPYNQGEGWVPIGTNMAPFNGTFDGDGHTIINLTINRAIQEYLGLFARTGPEAEIRNIGLEHVNVKGSYDLGGLVGLNDGTITNAYVVGEVFGEHNNIGGLVGKNFGTIISAYAEGEVSGKYYVGGLVGLNDGTITNAYATGAVTGNENVGGLLGGHSGNAANAYATGTVTGFNYVGGLAGKNSEGTITNAYATGAVTGNENVGGLVGINFQGIITSAYATGAVTGFNYVGGLVGSVYQGTVTNAYATGAVTGNENVGGLVGSVYQGTVTNAYYNQETTGQDDTGKGEPKTAAEMQRLDTYAGWDFNNVWYMRENYTYPQLRWERESWPDYSEFNADLEVPGGKYSGQTFNLSITGARGVFDNVLNGVIPVTVVSDQDGDVYNGTVTFTNGNAAVPVTLNATDTQIQTLTIQVNEVTASKTVEVQVIALAGIAITTPPDKTEYFVGEALDLTGLVVTGTYTDNSQQVLPVTTAHVSGFDSSAPAEDQAVTVTWEGKTAAFTVVIIEPVLTGIAITAPPDKTEYFVGEALDLTGLVVTGTYTDNSQQSLPVGMEHVSGFDSSAPAEDQAVTVTWEGETAAFTVTIVEKPDTEAPTVPANFRSTGKTATAISLAWDESVDNSDVGHYELEMKQGSGVWKQAAAPADTAHTLTGLSPSTAYTFRVRAADGAGNRSDWSDELIIVTNSNRNSGSSGGNNNDDVRSSERFIDVNGQATLPADIDTFAPSAILQVEPTDTDSDYVSIPASILNDFTALNPNFVLEIQAPYGSYLLPAALPSLVPGWEALLEENDWQTETIGFKLTMNDRTEDSGIREGLSVRLPSGKLIGAAVEMHLEIVNVDTGEILTEISRFTEPVIRIIPVTSEDFEAGRAMWGAFRHDEATGEFGFVPARLEDRDGRLVVVILSRSNSVYVVMENATSFSDTERHWGRTYAEQAAARGLVYGVGDGKFAPDKPVTRAEFAAMLVRAWGRGTASGTLTPYEDVAREAWYNGEVAAAKELGLLNFVEGDRFRPDKPLTREEMASMLAAAVRLEMPSPPEKPSSLAGYRDQADMEAGFIDDIRLMATLGIMTGTASDRFSPKMDVTRAQAASVLIRALGTLGWIDGLQDRGPDQ